MPVAQVFTITVTFDPEAVPMFSFSPKNEFLEGATGGQGYLVNWVLASPAQNVKFDESPIVWMDSTPPGLTQEWTLPSSLPSGPTLPVLNNLVTNNTEENFGYKVTVLHNGQAVESRDPELVLQPPG
jgi:hypothetical protein